MLSAFRSNLQKTAGYEQLQPVYPNSHCYHFQSVLLGSRRGQCTLAVHVWKPIIDSFAEKRSAYLGRDEEKNAGMERNSEVACFSQYELRASWILALFAGISQNCEIDKVQRPCVFINEKLFVSNSIAYEWEALCRRSCKR
mmetsp:Transcript_24922/g.59179  ORF Transcript_24922/g.59179 Transcript_24922/m.59179 type:complete len:141 (-) Transcript_24922:1042-1464(-)